MLKLSKNNFTSEVLSNVLAKQLFNITFTNKHNDNEYPDSAEVLRLHIEDTNKAYALDRILDSPSFNIYTDLENEEEFTVYILVMNSNEQIPTQKTVHILQYNNKENLEKYHSEYGILTRNSILLTDNPDDWIKYIAMLSEICFESMLANNNYFLKLDNKSIMLKYIKNLQFFTESVFDNGAFLAFNIEQSVVNYLKTLL